LELGFSLPLWGAFCRNDEKNQVPVIPAEEELQQIEAAYYFP